MIRTPHPVLPLRSKLGHGDSKFLELPVMAKLGNENILDLGGTMVFETSNGLFIEHHTGNRSYEANGAVLVKIYRTHLSEDIWPLISRWLTGEQIDRMLAAYNGDKEAADDIARTWYRDMCESDAIEERVEVLAMAADLYGWDAIDPEPLELSLIELQMRWFGTFALEGPSSLNLLTVLQRLAPGRYSELLQEAAGRPLDAETLTVTIVEETPPGYAFSHRGGVLGFWRNDAQVSN